MRQTRTQDRANDECSCKVAHDSRDFLLEQCGSGSSVKSILANVLHQFQSQQECLRKGHTCCEFSSIAVPSEDLDL